MADRLRDGSHQARPSPAARLRCAAFAVGAAGTATAWEVWTAAANARWYAGLAKPTFSPPPWLAGMASVALGLVLAYALFRVLCRPDYLPDRPGAIRLFLISLGLDALWAFMFFAGRHPTVALAVSAALCAATAATAWRCSVVDRRAGLLLVLWVLATAFVFLLDLSIALRNG